MTGRPLTYGSLFTGIGGFDVGFDRAGMRCAFQCDLFRPDESPYALSEHNAEIEAATSPKQVKKIKSKWAELNNYGRSTEKVLERHYPHTQRINDVKEINSQAVEAVDLICGGFPCQDVSVAGLRAGLAGKRSGLWFEFHRILADLNPRWVVIENVPGLLSSNGGQDFAVILRGLVECGYGVAWRILDAQYFGVAQRRRRVFIVGSLGSGRAAQVLFESESGAWDSAPSREARQIVAAIPASGAGTSRTGNARTEAEKMIAVIKGASIGREPQNGPQYGEVITDGSSYTLNSSEVHAVAFQQNTRDEVRMINGDGAIVGALSAEAGMKQQNYIAKALTAKNQRLGDGSEETFIVSAIDVRNMREQPDGISGTLQSKKTGGHSLNYQNPIIAFDPFMGGSDRTVIHRKDGIAQLSGREDAIAGSMGVRRLMPIECERLQGFPDNHTAGQSDSTRYRQTGNAVAVPCSEWLGKRIAAIEALPAPQGVKA